MNLTIVRGESDGYADSDHPVDQRGEQVVPGNTENDNANDIHIYLCGRPPVHQATMSIFYDDYHHENDFDNYNL